MSSYIASKFAEISAKKEKHDINGPNDKNI